MPIEINSAALTDIVGTLKVTTTAKDANIDNNSLIITEPNLTFNQDNLFIVNRSDWLGNDYLVYMSGTKLEDD